MRHATGVANYLGVCCTPTSERRAGRICSSPRSTRKATTIVPLTPLSSPPPAGKRLIICVMAASISCSGSLHSAAQPPAQDVVVGGDDRCGHQLGAQGGVQGITHPGADELPKSRW